LTVELLPLLPEALVIMSILSLLGRGFQILTIMKELPRARRRDEKNVHDGKRGEIVAIGCYELTAVANIAISLRSAIVGTPVPSCVGVDLIKPGALYVRLLVFFLVVMLYTDVDEPAPIVLPEEPRPATLTEAQQVRTGIKK
jgi:hypothetical protein